jgi:antitoxin Phd
VPLQDWQRLQRSARPTLKELLLSATPRTDLAIPQRGRLRRRRPDETA